MFFNISVTCDTFSSYLYEEKHSLKPPWIHSLWKFMAMMLSRCQLDGDERSLDSLPPDSVTRLLCGDHFLLVALCSIVLYSLWRRRHDGLLLFIVERVQALLFIPLCHLVVDTWSIASLCFSHCVSKVLPIKTGWTGQRSLQGIIQNDRHPPSLVLVHLLAAVVSSLNLRDCGLREETPWGNTCNVF